MFFVARERGYDLETAAHGVCQLANERLPKADRWTKETETRNS
jgi:hypothetical protein